MKKIFIIILTTFFAFTSNAQDSSLEWVKQIGGTELTSHATSGSMELDAIGNIYITGFFKDTVDFDPGLAVQNLVSAGEFDIFVLKLDPEANFLWVKQMGGSLGDYGLRIFLDANSNVYTVGRFEGTVDFDSGTGVQNLVSNEGENGYIQKLDSNGNFLWAKHIKCNDWLISSSVSVDGNFNVYIRGTFRGIADFDPGSGTENLDSEGLTDEYLLKLDSEGNFLWVKQWGVSANDHGYSVSIDDANNIYTIGTYGGDILIQKLDPAGNLLWEKQVISTTGGAGELFVTLDASGNLLATGSFNGILDFGSNSGISNISTQGLRDILVLKLDPNGNFLWGKSMGGSGFDRGYSITTNSSNEVYLTGAFEGTVDFDPGQDVQNLTSAGSRDHFILKLDAAGNYQWVKQNSDILSVEGYSIATNADNDIYTVGSFGGTVDFDPGPEVHNLFSTGRSIFIQKLSIEPLGVSNYNSAPKFDIYPNPGKGTFTISFEAVLTDISLRVVDALGRTVYSDLYPNTDHLAFDIDGPTGVYFVHLKTVEGKIITPIVKR